jgi:hypothetical protein
MRIDAHQGGATANPQHSVRMEEQMSWWIAFGLIYLVVMAAVFMGAVENKLRAAKSVRRERKQP